MSKNPYMKVYAEYFKEENGKEYRKKTLLHFGDSTKLIGSAVLMNPGSAKPNGNPNTDIIHNFYAQNHKINNINPEHWKAFAADSTMRQLEKIFSGSYLGKPIELNGIIQLFNCFYYRDPNLDTALENHEKDSKYNFSENEFFLNKPVYFGWGNVGKNGKLKDIALEIFKKYNLKHTPIYNSNFEDNYFYHPGYINRSFSKNKNTVKLLKDFYTLNTKL